MPIWPLEQDTLSIASIMFTFANPGLSGKLPIRSIPYSSIQFHHEPLITSIAKDFKGSITYPFMLPCHDSLASSFHTARIEQVAVCTHGEE